MRSGRCAFLYHWHTMDWETLFSCIDVKINKASILVRYCPWHRCCVPSRYPESAIYIHTVPIRIRTCMCVITASCTNEKDTKARGIVRAAIPDVRRPNYLCSDIHTVHCSLVCNKNTWGFVWTVTWMLNLFIIPGHCFWPQKVKSYPAI